MLRRTLLATALLLASLGPLQARAHATDAVVRTCRQDSLRLFERYHRGLTRCFARSARTADGARLAACRRERLLRLESRLARIELSARRAARACATDRWESASAAGADRPDQRWLAALLSDAVATGHAKPCPPARIRALGRHAVRLSRCARDGIASGWDDGAVESCREEATIELVAGWGFDGGLCGEVDVYHAVSRLNAGTALQWQELTITCEAELAAACDGAAGEAAAAADPCADETARCPEATSCVSTGQTYACAVPCTQAGFEAGIAACGGGSRRLTFDCRNRTIPIAEGGGWGNRRVRCDHLVIDGLDRNISFELDPPCYETAGEACPDVDDGTGFLLLEGNDITVRNLTIRRFFDGIQSRGASNTIERVKLVRHCDDAVTNAASAVGTLFRDLVIKNGCDKCSQSFGDAALLSTDASEREHYNAIFDRVDFVGCAQPLRMTDGGRFLVRDSLMLARRGTGFPCRGPFFSSSGDRGVTVHVHGSIVAGCRRGIRVGGGAQMTLAATLIERSAVAGLRAVGDARVSIAGSRILANGGRTSVERGSGGLVVVDEAAVDVGGGEVEIDGLPPSAGGNLLCGNVDRSQTLLAVDASQVRDPERAASARNNWWCDADPPAAISGNVDFTPSFDFPR